MRTRSAAPASVSIGLTVETKAVFPGKEYRFARDHARKSKPALGVRDRPRADRAVTRLENDGAATGFPSRS